MLASFHYHPNIKSSLLPQPNDRKVTLLPVVIKQVSSSLGQLKIQSKYSRSLFGNLEILFINPDQIDGGFLVSSDKEMC